MRRQRLELVAASFLMLFVELVAIRWSGAWIVHLSYFANFVLLGSFLGIGIGFLRAHKGPDLFAWSPVVIALFLGLVSAFPAQIDRTGGDLVFFGVRQTGLPAWVLLPLVFCATAASLATVAHGVAVRFTRFPALEAYRLDILGSILGIVAFSVLAFTGTGSIGWGVVIVATSLWLLGKPSPLQLVAFASLLAVLALGTFRYETIWSPYYRLRLGHDEGLVAVDANGVPHQAAIRTEGTDYELPYDRIATAPDSVLVIGAGNGNDVSVALRQGASRVDAVEIDPKLMEIGERFHPEQPYEDPRVRQFVDDGRAFLERTDDRYGLIVFALPDSLTLLSGQSAVRLESYLFTREAFRAAAEHLEPQGAFTIYNFYREQWLADRLAGTLTEVFGERPCFDLGESRGPGEVGRLSVFVASADPAVLRCEERWDPQDRSVVAPAVDDRPFLYLQERSIPSRYLVALALVLLASIVFIRIGGGSFRPMFRYADLFFMGAAFLLLETKSVVQFALLFGTTWFVNSLVFVGVLLSSCSPSRWSGGSGWAPRTPPRGLVPRPLRRLVHPHRVAARPAGRPSSARGDLDRVLPHLRREPDLRREVPGHRGPDRRLRCEPSGRHGGRDPGVSVAFTGFRGPPPRCCALRSGLSLGSEDGGRGVERDRSSQARAQPDPRQKDGRRASRSAARPKDRRPRPPATERTASDRVRRERRPYVRD